MNLIVYNNTRVTVTGHWSLVTGHWSQARETVFSRVARESTREHRGALVVALCLAKNPARCLSQSLAETEGGASPHHARLNSLSAHRVRKRSKHIERNGHMTKPEVLLRTVIGRCVVGIDVAKTWLDVAVRSTCPSGIPGTSWRVANSDATIPALVELFRALAPQVIVLEASGGYERLVVACLAEADLPLVVVKSRTWRDFAKAIGRLDKTDRLYAQVLAQFGEAIHPAPRFLPDAACQQLAVLLERRSQLVGMLTAENNRFQQALTTVLPHIAARIAWLEWALEKLDREARPGTRPNVAGQLSLARTEAAAQYPWRSSFRAFTLLGDQPELSALMH
jgi:transposase